MKIVQGLTPTQNGIANVKTAKAVSAPQFDTAGVDPSSMPEVRTIQDMYMPEEQQAPQSTNPGDTLRMLQEMVNGGSISRFGA
jgi:hypothetical protein